MISCSVIVPNYNHAAYLQDRIESILAQTLSPLEIILLDDASTDNSREIIKRYRDDNRVTQIIYNSSNSGSPFLQWKKGIELAKGDWVWIAESDDIAEAHFLETAAQMIGLYPGINIFYCNSLIKGAVGQSMHGELFSAIKNKTYQTEKWSHDYHNDSATELAEGLSLRCTINNASAALMRKEALMTCLDQLALFRFHGDWYCYLYLLQTGSVAYSAKPLNSYRSYSSQVQQLLPENGWDRLECFRILAWQLKNLPVKDKELLVREFSRLYLHPGLWQGKKDWAAFFKINPKLAWKTLSAKLFR
jgi:glycosyltransferase involved in cell wall biosynthesis